MEVWLDLLRRKSPGERAAAALSASDLVTQMVEAGVRLAYPDADEREVYLRVAARRLGRDLTIQIFGWDPDLNDHVVRRP